MVGWYAPSQLAKTGIEVAISTIFGRHSDHRLVEAMASGDDVPGEDASGDDASRKMSPTKVRSHFMITPTTISTMAKF